MNLLLVAVVGDDDAAVGVHAGGIGGDAGHVLQGGVDHMALIGVHGLQSDTAAVLDHLAGHLLRQMLEALLPLFPVALRVQLDAEGYREKREQSLQHLAKKVAGKVVKYRRSVTLEPMNAYERHVIHTALQDVPGVTTYSTGVDPNRRVIVAYDRDKK